MNLEDSSYAGERSDGEAAEGDTAEQGADEVQQDDGDWEVAAVSANAARRRRRKQSKYEARLAANSSAEAASQPPDSTQGDAADDASISDDGVLSTSPVYHQQMDHVVHLWKIALLAQWQVYCCNQVLKKMGSC